MPVTSVSKDPDTLTMTVHAEFAATLQRVWDAYTDPRQIERFWGPPTYPATFTRHDCVTGGRSTYHMTGPTDPTRDDQHSDLEEEVLTHGGYWEWIDVKPPQGTVASFEIRDGFLTEDDEPNVDLPTMRVTFDFEEVGEVTQLRSTTFFNSVDQMQEILEMGMEDGLMQAMGQIDEILADLTSFAAERAVEAQILNDTQVRFSRMIRGSVQQVWDANHDPELVRQWMLGPDGWTMPVCEVATEVSATYRYEWEQEDGGGRFGFTGEVVEMDPPFRSVTTEGMIGMDGPTTTNELTLTATSAGTLLTIVITYPSAEVRDQILATGMTDGMELSYARLEELLPT